MHSRDLTLYTLNGTWKSTLWCSQSHWKPIENSIFLLDFSSVSDWVQICIYHVTHDVCSTCFQSGFQSLLGNCSTLFLGGEIHCTLYFWCSFLMDSPTRKLNSAELTRSQYIFFTIHINILWVLQKKISYSLILLMMACS